MATSLAVPAIELKDAQKSFGNVQALKGINLSVASGETVAVLGPNGAGKTTAISLMLGLRRPTKGQAMIFGQNPTHLQSRKRVGAMLQESGVPPTLQVHEVIELFRRMYPSPLSTSEVIALADLESKAKARVGTLSGGQKQRLYFAVAIVGNPDVLFLDEPTVAMDVESRIGFWNQMEFFARRGKTILLTTHNLEEADALANRVIVINQGQIIAEGTSAEIKSHVGGKHIRVPEQALSREAIAALPGVKEVRYAHGVVDLLSDHSDATVEALLRQGVPLSSLEISNAGLEEAFLSLTARHEAN